MDLLADLEFRGQLYQQTDAEGLCKHLASPRKVYCGFDPTKESLTIGNLVQILLLRRFQQAGHTPVVVMGGGTGAGAGRATGGSGEFATGVHAAQSTTRTCDFVRPRTNERR